MSEHQPSRRAQVNNQCPWLNYTDEVIEKLFLALDKNGSFDAPTGELSFAFVSKTEIARIHGDFMDDPTPTDVITFPGDPEHDQAGDICVSPEVALEYSVTHQLDFSEELTLYLIHGYLHLCGFDDIEDPDRQAMRQAEATAMGIAKQLGVIPTFSYSAK